MRITKHIVPAIAIAIMLASCGGGSKSNPEIDSLKNVIESQNAERQTMDLFLDAVNVSMDSLIKAEGDILQTKKESPLSKKEQIKRNIEAYKLMMKRQQERLADLEKKVKGSNWQNAKLLQTIESLKAQIAEKDSIIEVLNGKLSKSNLDIKNLQNDVARLNINVSQLTDKTNAQEQTITEQTNKMNEAYVIIGDKKLLKQAGVLSGGTILRKSKLDLSKVNVSKFNKIDIRNTKEFKIPGKNPTIMSQVPSGSYNIQKKSDGTCLLTITDPDSFWSVTNYLVIKY